MRWGKVKRKLQQKPYLLDPYRVRSRRDARKMLYEQGLPCAAEVLEAARIRAGKSLEEWESLIGMSREKAGPQMPRRNARALWACCARFAAGRAGPWRDPVVGVLLRFHIPWPRACEGGL